MDARPRVSHGSRRRHPNACVKCAGSGAVELNGNDVFCRPCFGVYAMRKFRSCLGKHRLFRHLERCLVHVGGGRCGRVLLSLVCTSATASEKRLAIDPVFVHVVDDRAHLHPETYAEWKAYVAGFGFQLHFIYFGSVFRDELDESCLLMDGCGSSPDDEGSSSSVTSDLDHEADVLKLFGSIASATGRNEIRNRLRTVLLYKTALFFHCPYVMLDHCCTELVSYVVAAVAQGRASQLKDDLATVDTRWKAVSFVRPLRCFDLKEIALFDHYFVERPIAPPPASSMMAAVGFSSSQGDDSSLHAEALLFLVGLQLTMGCATSTVFSAVNKLSDARDHGTAGVCLLCHSRVDPAPDPVDDASLFSRLCNGCRVTLIEVGDVALLKSAVVSFL